MVFTGKFISLRSSHHFFGAGKLACPKKKEYIAIQSGDIVDLNKCCDPLSSLHRNFWRNAKGDRVFSRLCCQGILRSPLTHASMSVRERLIGDGSTGRWSRSNQPAETISLLSIAISPVSYSATNPHMREFGNGHGSLATYRRFFIVMPTSSCTSRYTVCSSVSPGSTKPAMMLCMPTGK